MGLRHDRLGTGAPVPIALVVAFGLALAVLVGYAILLADDPGPARGDGAAADLAGSLEAGWLTVLVKVLTALGDPIALIAIAVLAGAGLAWRGRGIEAASVLIGMAIILVAVPELKEAVGRPRPAEGLTDPGGLAYPSGHAANAAIYGWLAILLAAHRRPGFPSAAAIVLGGIAVVALVGLTRVYLGVHYLSDVTGGWALGACSFTGSAGAALLLTSIRQNLSRGA